MITHPALLLLAKRKFAAAFRNQLRRARTPKGALFAIIGVCVIIIWLSSIVFGPAFSRRLSDGPPDAANAVLFAEGGLLLLLFLNLFVALGHRGLYIPKDEIEVLFCSPFSRGQIIRYRILVNFVKSLLGGVVLGLVSMRRCPVPIYGFLGTFVAMQTLPICGQMMSVISGDAENRWLAKAPKGFIRGITIGAFLLIFGFVAGLFVPDRGTWSRVLQTFINDGGTGIFQHPIFNILATPVKPWAYAATAQDGGQFLLWFGVSIGIWILLFFIAGRLSIDYRELSLETAADVAKRLQRMRRGGGSANATKASAKLVGWRMPWIFGRGPFGALAWRKSMSILRKARATLLVSSTIVGLLSVILSLLLRDQEAGDKDLMITILFAFIGCIYLSNGLRFDFREDLDKIEFFKTCPTSSWKIFVATLAPQTMLVSALVYVMILIKSIVVEALHPATPLVAIGVPIFTFIWIAIDNIVFLVAPTRAVAGQDTMLQNAGRVIILMIARFFVLVLVFLGAAIPAVVAYAILSLIFHDSGARTTVVAICSIGGLLTAAVESALLVFAGGEALRRFDVAADRP